MSLLRLSYVIAVRRIVSNWRLEMVLFLGIVLAVTLMSSGVIFSDLLAEAALGHALNQATPEDANFQVRAFIGSEAPATVAGRTAALNRPLEDALAREARLGAGLNHPAIAAVYDFGFHRGRAFTVFEYVDGDALRSILNRQLRLLPTDALPIIGSLARALDFAHSHGIVHRDLKPENIRASKQGEFKILDLGLAEEFRRKNARTAQ